MGVSLSPRAHSFMVPSLVRCLRKTVNETMRLPEATT